MLDLLISRLLPAIVFGAAAAGLLWLLGLLRKRGAAAAAVALALAFLADRWDTTLLLAGQLVVAGAAGRLSRIERGLSLRDVAGLTSAAAVAAWGLLFGAAPAYWNAAVAGGAAGAALAWVGRAGSLHWSGARLRLLTLRPTEIGGYNGPGFVAGLGAAILVTGLALALGAVGPGEPALVLTGAVAAVAVADLLRTDATGLVAVAGFLGGGAAAGLVAFLP